MTSQKKQNIGFDREKYRTKKIECALIPLNKILKSKTAYKNKLILIILVVEIN